MAAIDIPADVLAAADLVSDYFSTQGVTDWELGDLRSRFSDAQMREDGERFRALPGRIKTSKFGVMLDDTSRLQEWRQMADRLRGAR